MPQSWPCQLICLFLLFVFSFVCVVILNFFDGIIKYDGKGNVFDSKSYTVDWSW